MSDLLLHVIEAEYQLLIAGYPVNHGIGHVLQVLRLLLAGVHIVLRRLLQFQGEISTY